MNRCPHCGAVPTGELLGFPVVIHAEDCPNSPGKVTVEEMVGLVAALPPAPRWLCSLCGCVAETEKELQHALGCPANPLTN